jgi:hypothetical protein
VPSERLTDEGLRDFMWGDVKERLVVSSRSPSRSSSGPRHILRNGKTEKDGRLKKDVMRAEYEEENVSPLSSLRPS